MPTERAGYTVTMFLIDVSPSMGKLRSVEIEDNTTGEIQTVEMTNLEWALRFVLLKIQEMIYAGRKTEQCGVILFGTEETENIVADEKGGYEHVSEFIPIAQPNASTLSKLQSLTPSTEIGDPIDAIIVGIQTQDKYLGKKKSWTRKMVILTDGESPIELEDWEMTAAKISELQIYTTIVGIDFDDEEFGYEEPEKSNVKRENESFFHEFISSLQGDLGVIGTAAFALQECMRPDVKVTKSALLGSVLRLGDPDTRPEEAVELPIKMSKCTAAARPPSLKKFAKRSIEEDESTLEDTQSDTDRKDTYAQLTIETEYNVVKNRADEDENDGVESQQAEKPTEKVDSEQLIRGFKYGASYVPCPDGQFPRLSTRKGLDICGFFPEDQVRRDFAIGEVQYVWADPSSGRVQVEFSSIVKAMAERKVVAIARLVSRDEMDPKMGLLIPRQLEEVDCFLWLQMPFADDVRRYTFPPLEKLVSKKGEPITEHPFLPTEKQMDAMDKFVDAMDLMEAGEKDEEGNRTPWFDPRLSYNPAVHRIKQAVFHAATVTDLRFNPLPPPHPEITKYFEPPRKVQKRAKASLATCKEVFNIKQVPKRIAQNRKTVARHVDDDDDDLLLEGPQGNTYKTGSQSISQGLSQTQESDSKTPKKERRGTVTSDGSISSPDLRKSRLKTLQASESIIDITQSQSQSQNQSQSQSQSLGMSQTQDEVDYEFISKEEGRLLSTSNPLADLQELARSNKKINNLSEIIGALESILKEVLNSGFAARRYDELVECMQELRVLCKKQGAIDTWNHFLRNLKHEHLDSPKGSNKQFWDKLSASKESVNLIARSEAEKLGLQSNASDEEAREFL
ncbi:hypothetical protein PNOK_0168800 [Pyrrhoderma noxium]|uniref:ATP-dependent DNA helicase II subunit 2 n=1 Tax=Pyrrhoderma noxium TaxID=2282107 RepID=A0A286UQ59_9AGAM|nr:hypothetical protein PNOK_0168800 [Pyrrhoderma noxium]